MPGRPGGHCGGGGHGHGHGGHGQVGCHGGKRRCRPKRGRKHMKCHKKGKECHGSSSSSCSSSDSDNGGHGHGHGHGHGGHGHGHGQGGHGHGHGQGGCHGGKRRRRPKRGRKHIKCHKKGKECHGSSSSSCSSSDSD